MNEETDAVARVQGMIYQAVREAVSHELLIYHVSTVQPMMELAIEAEKLLKSIADGQILVEKTLANLTTQDDSEPWRESLDD
jgi:hypothetical protein